MRIIARSTLTGFVRNRVEPRLRKVVGEHLDAWFAVVSRANWKSSAELKRQHRTASIVTAERVVFNIKGNDYRLVAAVDFQHGIVLVLWLGTHREYDQIDVSGVVHRKERYADSSHSNGG
ncbi:MAG: type II toxin-antitoxin system HigB family toxin [Terracidiphilus sp.]